MSKLIVIGTGTAIVTKYHNTSFVLDDGKEYFLVDGTGGNEILSQFEKMNLDWGKLHNAFLSHNHTDHLLGMIWVIRNIAFLILKGYYKGKFNLYGHVELLEKVKTICELCINPKEYALFGKFIFFIPVQDGECVSVLSYEITFFDTLSVKSKQFGFSLIDKERMKIVFLGDQPLTEAGEKYAENADWLLAEAFCLYSEREIHTPYEYCHSTVKEASENAMRFHVKNLVLWHTEDVTTYGRRKELYSEESKKYYNGNIWVPDDGEIITISD